MNLILERILERFWCKLHVNFALLRPSDFGSHFDFHLLLQFHIGISPSFDAVLLNLVIFTLLQWINSPFVTNFQHLSGVHNYFVKRICYINICTSSDFCIYSSHFAASFIIVDTVLQALEKIVTFSPSSTSIGELYLISPPSFWRDSPPFIIRLFGDVWMLAVWILLPSSCCILALTSHQIESWLPDASNSLKHIIIVQL